MKRTVITVKYDITDFLPNNGKDMDDDEVIEYVHDTPEIFSEGDAELEYKKNVGCWDSTMIWKIERLD